MKKWTTWALESAKVTHWHDAAADNDCSGDTPACLKSRLNTIKCEICRSFGNFHASHDGSVMPVCFIYAVFVLQLFELSIFDLASVLVRLLSLLSFSPWALTPPPPPLPLSLCFTGGGWLSLPPGLAITRKPLVNCSFWFLPNVPRPDLHLLHISLPNSQVALCSSFHFSSGFTVAYEHVTKLVLLFFSPYSGHSCLEAHHHYRLSSFFTIFTFKPAYMVSFLISALLEYLNFLFYFLFFYTKFKSITWSSLGNIMLQGENMLAV